MTDFLSGTFNIIPQSQAQWDADNRVLRSDTVALVTDGSNKGKHKIGRGAPYTFADLDYVEDGGGGGGISDGDTLSIGLTFPQNGLKTEAPSGDTLSINANGTQTADRTLSVDIGDSDKQLEITGNAVLSGDNTGDEHTIITTWRDWTTDEILGGPSMPVDLITHYGWQYGANHASGADSGLILVLPMPLKYQGGEMGITLYGTVTGGETGNCAIYCKAQVINTGDGMTGLSADGAIPTPSTLTATGLADGDLWAKDFSINPSGTWAAGSMLAIFFGRNGAAGSDTYPESLYIHSMRITYSGAA